MNSLNILSARVIGPAPPQTPTSNRPRSYSDGNLQRSNALTKPRRSASQHTKGAQADVFEEKEKAFTSSHNQEASKVEAEPDLVNEKTPLLVEAKDGQSPMNPSPQYTKLRLAAKRLVAALTKSLRWVLSTLASPGVYLVGRFYDEKGTLSPLLPMRKIGRILPKRNGRRSTTQAVGLSGSSTPSELAAGSADAKSVRRKAQVKDLRRKLRSADSFAATSESELEVGTKTVILDTPTDGRSRLQPSSSSEDEPQARRSIRIKLYNEDVGRRRKQKKEKNTPNNTSREPTLTVANLKSPTSPTSSLKTTKYPRAPAPPRPLIPRRQPSYSVPSASRTSRLAQKTLVIDLDETLIHSMAKGGRMSSGHMVEVKLNTTVGYGGATLGPQHPILYYVHKRPHCDEFLRKVCKWYNLVVFTASVQEYADPVIDWLEQERKYFSGRYYRQHCTFRNGAYIKDLSSIEPDLSNVMILDNSPLSYIFHEGKVTTTNVPRFSC